MILLPYLYMWLLCIALFGVLEVWDNRNKFGRLYLGSSLLVGILFGVVLVAILVGVKLVSGGFLLESLRF
jgi:hypothetical protein